MQRLRVGPLIVMVVCVAVASGFGGFMFGRESPSNENSGLDRSKPHWAYGRWTPVERKFADQYEVIFFKEDSSYDWQMSGSTPRLKAVGVYQIRDFSITFEPDLFSIDADSCGGSKSRTLERGEYKGRTALVATDGTTYVRTADWSDLSHSN